MPKARAQRQPLSDAPTTNVPITAARIQPTAQKASSRTTMRPRTFRGANSEMRVEATGSSAPRPSPMKKRRMMSNVRLVARADAPVARPYTSNVRAKMWRRPNLSAKSPPKVAPSAMPMKPTEASHEDSVGVIPQCTARAAMMKEMRPTSMASSAHPMPEPKRRRLCLGVTGRRSSRSVRETVRWSSWFMHSKSTPLR